MGAIKIMVKTHHNRYTMLDKTYRNFILNNFNTDFVDRLEIYNIIINELIVLGEYDSVDEIKYRITDGENPNDVILDIINKIPGDNYLMWLVKPNIKTFLEEDLIKKYT